MTEKRTDAPEPKLTADQRRRVWRVVEEALRPPEERDLPEEVTGG